MVESEAQGRPALDEFERPQSETTFEELEHPRSTVRRSREDIAPLIAGAICIILGVAVVAAGGYSFLSTVRILANAGRVEGTIVRIDVETSTSSNKDGASSTSASYLPVVSFRDEGDEQHTFKSGTDSPDARVGDKVSVVYNRDNPGEARIDSFSSLWGPSIFMYIFGAVVLGIGLLCAGPLRRLLIGDLHIDSTAMVTAGSGLFTLIGLVIVAIGVLFLVQDISSPLGLVAAAEATGSSVWVRDVLPFVAGAVVLFLGIGSFLALGPPSNRATMEAVETVEAVEEH